MRSNSSSSTTENVISATAGSDTWQTWAGRKHGSENFEFMDVVRGMRHSIHHRLRYNMLPTGTTCPICFCEPNKHDKLHITWCGCTVCVDCLRQYAVNQVEDREQRGKLKCPVCLKTLRKKDAIIAMAGNSKLIRQWDFKIRDHLLRAIPSFRSCPKCDGKNGGGGGFVTPECLGVHHQERRDAAKNTLQNRNKALFGILGMYFVLIGFIASNNSPSASADLFSVLLPIYVFGKIALAVQYWLVLKARQQLYRPISVGCPCCDENFVLPVESEHFQNEETSRWMDTNTRPCPSCSVPIIKASGCNNMTCTHCKAKFCWACMRLSISCRAYKCHNGAPYRNAVPLFGGGGEQQTLQLDGSITTYIDNVLNNRQCPEINYSDGVLILLCLVARHSSQVQVISNRLMSFFVSVFVPLSSLAMTPIALLCFTYINRYLQIRIEDRRINQAQEPQQLPADPQRIEALNQNMITEAIHRSIEDQ